MNCPICVLPLSVPARLNCGHYLDLHCIGEWLNRYNKTCPLCRTSVTEIVPCQLEGLESVSAAYGGLNGVSVHVSLDAPISVLVDVRNTLDLCCLEGRKTVVLDLLDVQLAKSITAADFQGTISRGRVTSVDIIEAVSGRWLGEHEANSYVKLRDIALREPSCLVRAHVMYSWHPD